MGILSGSLQLQHLSVNTKHKQLRLHLPQLLLKLKQLRLHLPQLLLKLQQLLHGQQTAPRSARAWKTGSTVTQNTVARAPTASASTAEEVSPTVMTGRWHGVTSTVPAYQRRIVWLLAPDAVPLPHQVL